MDIFLAIKFHSDMRNRELIEQISASLEDTGFSTTVVARDHEDWGATALKPPELMTHALQAIRESDLLVVEFSEKGTGLGIEAGYAYANDIPVIVVAKPGSDISTTLQGIAEEILFYEQPDKIGPALQKLLG